MNSMVNNIYVLNQDKPEQASSCQSCMKKALCPVSQLVSQQGKTASVNMKGPLTSRAGEAIFHAGDDFKGFYIVRSGFFKSYYIDTNGEMQITGFHFPGEVFGIEGIESGQYHDTVEALDTGSLCRIPVSMFVDSGSAGQNSGLQLLPLIQVMGRAMARDRSLIFSLGKMYAKRRFASFLLDISNRMESSGYDSEEFRLCMSRIDMSNYLCLAIETISRLFSQFQAFGIIDVDRRNVKILNKQLLESLATDAIAEEEIKKRVAG